MSWSVSYDGYAQIEKTLSDLAGSGRRLGLVLFSDIAYEALPPGTQASELGRICASSPSAACATLG